YYARSKNYQSAMQQQPAAAQGQQASFAGAGAAAYSGPGQTTHPPLPSVRRGNGAPPPPPTQPPPPRRPAPSQPPPPRMGSSATSTLFLVFNNQRYPIAKDQFIIGRGSKTSDLPIKDGNISRK